MSVTDLSTKFKQAIKILAENAGYLTYVIKHVMIKPDGSNYMGQIYEVDVDGETKDGDKAINLFVKVKNGDGSIKFFSIDNLYRTELFVYKELAEVFAELQADAHVPLHERFKLVKSYEESSTEAIILENMTKKGFKTNHRLEAVTLEFAEMSMRYIAKLHGLSFALQNKRPDYFNTKIKGMMYPVDFNCSDWQEFATNMLNTTRKCFEGNELYDDLKSRAENTYDKLGKFVEYFNDEAARRCLCHGDLKSSNIMIQKYDEQNKDIIVVDYQCIHYGCPAMDVIYFFYMSTDHKLRNEHLQHLKDVYHNHLGTFLNYFNIDVESVYSRALFEQDFKEKLEYGLLLGFFYLPGVLAKEDDFPDITGPLSGISFQVSDAYKDRQRGIIDEFTKWSYI